MLTSLDQDVDRVLIKMSIKGTCLDRPLMVDALSTHDPILLSYVLNPEHGIRL